jgi:hypothetical protein
MARLGIYEVEVAPGVKARLQLDPEEAERRYPDAVEVKVPADGEVKTKSTRSRTKSTKE